MQMKYAAIGFYVTVVACALVLVLCACTPSSSNDVGVKADQGMDAITNPSAQDQLELTQKINAELGAVGSQSADTEADFASWFFSDASYVRESVVIDGDKAIVHYTVNCHDLASLASAASPGISLKDAMRSCTPTAKSVDMYLTSEDDTWTVSDAELNGIARQVFIGM